MKTINTDNVRMRIETDTQGNIRAYLQEIDKEGNVVGLLVEMRFMELLQEYPDVRVREIKKVLLEKYTGKAQPY